MWTNAMRGYDPKTGLYKDCAIGDTPKLYTIDIDGEPTKVVGAGCKNGGFYVLLADTGEIVRHMPIYEGPPTEPPASHDSRVLALPSPIGGLQSGCATDGRAIFTPIEDFDRCENCAKLFMIAENEELFDDKEHAILAHERATGVKKQITIPGIKHYGIYNEAPAPAQQEAIAWYDEHLKK